MLTKKQYPIFFATIMIVLSMIACELPWQSSSDDLDEDSDVLAEVPLQILQEATATPEPLLVPTIEEPSLPVALQSALEWEIEVFDDFSQEAGYWFLGVIEDDQAIQKGEISNGQYLMTVETMPAIDFPVDFLVRRRQLRESFTNFQISVKTGVIDGSADAAYGFTVFGLNEKFNRFAIQGDSFQFGEWWEDADPIIDWTFSDAIIPGEMNDLTMIVHDKNVTLLINDQIVSEIPEFVQTSGKLTFLIAASVANPNERVVVAFDDFLIKTPGPAKIRAASDWPVVTMNGFEGNEMGWPIGESNQASYSVTHTITDGVYRVDGIATSGFIHYMAPSMPTPTDFYLSVDVRLVQGPIQASHGVFFRQSDAGYYYFQLSADDDGGIASLYSWDQTTWTTLFSFSTQSILVGEGSVNRLEVVAEGSNFVLLINDTLVGEIEDTQHETGQAGTIIGLGKVGINTVWEFDNFVLRIPEMESITEVPQPTQTTEPAEVVSQPTSSIGSELTKTNPIDGAIMVFVPEGEFLMGSDEVDANIDEQPARMVYVDAFWLYQTPVTNREYRQCIQAGACEKSLGRHDPNDLPAINITWFEAVEYCEWAGGRLPSEAEWEKGARGPDGRTYPWGNTQPTCQFANYQGCYGNVVIEVGSFPNNASPYGALDMAGLVWEWASDWYDEDYYTYGPNSNPTGPPGGTFLYRVQRGGSFENNIFSLRTTTRGRSAPDKGDYRKGFRCVHEDLR